MRIVLPGPKVGLVWWGNIKPDPCAVMPAAGAVPLASVPGVTFYSLQKGEVPAEASTVPAGMNLIDLSWRHSGFCRHRGRNDAPRSGDHDRHGGRAPRGCIGAAGVDDAAVVAGLVLDARSQGQPVVSDDVLFRQVERGNWHDVAKRLADELSVWVGKYCG